MKTSSRLSLDDEEVSHLIEIQYEELYEQLLWMVVKQWLDLSLSLLHDSYIQLLRRESRGKINGLFIFTCNLPLHHGCLTQIFMPKTLEYWKTFPHFSPQWNHCHEHIVKYYSTINKTFISKFFLTFGWRWWSWNIHDDLFFWPHFPPSSVVINGEFLTKMQADH